MATTTTTTNALEFAGAYIEKSFLERAQLMLRYDVGAQRKQIPANSGKVVRFVRYAPLTSAPSDIVVTDEVTSNEFAITDQAVSATVSLYSGHVPFSEFYDLTTETGVNGLMEHVAVLAQQAGEGLDTVIRDELAGGGTVDYVNNVAAASDIATSDTIDGADVRKAFSDLELAKAPKFVIDRFMGYQAIIPTAVAHDLRGSSEWLDANTYVDNSLFKGGDLGVLHGVRFTTTNNQVIEADAGAGNVDVYTTFIFGRDAYGTVDLLNQPASLYPTGSQVMVSQPSDISVSNPAGLKGTAAWKAYFTAKVLNSAWLLELKSASSIGAN